MVIARAHSQNKPKTWTLHTLRSHSNIYTLELDFFFQSLGMSTILPIKFCAARLWLYALHLLLLHMGISSSLSSSPSSTFLFSCCRFRWTKRDRKIRSLSRFYRQCFHFCGIDITHFEANFFVFIYIDWMCWFVERPLSIWINLSLFVWSLFCKPNISSQFYSASLKNWHYVTHFNWVHTGTETQIYVRA